MGNWNPFCCPGEGECPQCQDGKIASCLRIDFSGWADDSCEICEWLNTPSFYLVGDEPNCRWTWAESCGGCDVQYMQAAIVYHLDTYKLFLWLGVDPLPDDDNGYQYKFQYDFGEDIPDCVNFSQLALSLVHEQGTCDASAVVPLATAVDGHECPQTGDICAWCDELYPPEQFEITITGVTNRYPWIDCHCDRVNGTFILDRTSCCIWQYLEYENGKLAMRINFTISSLGGIVRVYRYVPCLGAASTHGLHFSVSDCHTVNESHDLGNWTGSCSGGSFVLSV